MTKANRRRLDALRGRARKAYRFIRAFELDGFGTVMLGGIIPIPAPHFKRKRARTQSRPRVRAIVKRVDPPKDPLIDTLENYRKDAIEDGDYLVAFGAAVAQNWYEQNKKGNQPSPSG